MSFGDFFDFHKFQLGKWKDQIKEDPERPFIGAMDQAGSQLWGKILHKDYEPMVNASGGSTERTNQDAAAEGIHTGTHEKVDSVAKIISAIMTGKWLSGLGGAGTGASGIGGEAGGGVAEGGAVSGADGAAGSPWWQQFAQQGGGMNMGGESESSYDAYQRMKIARALREMREQKLQMQQQTIPYYG